MLSHESRERLRGGFRDRSLDVFVRRSPMVLVSCRAAQGEPSRHGESLQLVAPVSFCFAQVLGLKPGDIVTVRARRRKLQLLAATGRSVEGEKFLEQQLVRPSVNQQVMC